MGLCFFSRPSGRQIQVKVVEGAVLVCFLLRKSGKGTNREDNGQYVEQIPPFLVGKMQF